MDGTSGASKEVKTTFKNYTEEQLTFMTQERLIPYDLALHTCTKLMGDKIDEVHHLYRWNFLFSAIVAFAFTPLCLVVTAKLLGGSSVGSWFLGGILTVVMAQLARLAMYFSLGSLMEYLDRKIKNDQR